MSEDITAAMARLYGPPERLSLAEIGTRFGMSRQAVQQRLERAGVPRRDHSEARMVHYDDWKQREKRKIEKAVRAADPISARDLAAELDVPLAWMQRWLTEKFGSALVTTYRLAGHFTDDEMKTAVKTVYESVDDAGTLSQGAYDKRRAAGAPRARTIALRFGSWSKLCALLDIPCERRQRIYETTWPRARCLEVIAEYIRECQATEVDPRAFDYEERWRADHEGPAIGTIRKACGSWRAAVVAAMR